MTTSARNASHARALAQSRLGVRGLGGRAAAHSHVGAGGVASEVEDRLSEPVSAPPLGGSLCCRLPPLPQPHPKALDALDPPPTEAEVQSESGRKTIRREQCC